MAGKKSQLIAEITDSADRLLNTLDNLTKAIEGIPFVGVRDDGSGYHRRARYVGSEIDPVLQQFEIQNAGLKRALNGLDRYISKNSKKLFKILAVKKTKKFLATYNEVPNEANLTVKNLLSDLNVLKSKQMAKTLKALKYVGDF